MSAVEKAIMWSNIVATGGVHKDGESDATLTVYVGPQSSGRAIEARLDDGAVWYGVVDMGGVALLTRSGLLAD